MNGQLTSEFHNSRQGSSNILKNWSGNIAEVIAQTPVKLRLPATVGDKLPMCGVLRRAGVSRKSRPTAGKWRERTRGTMAVPRFDQFLKASAGDLPRGAVALIVAEDDIGVGATIRHHNRLGFRNILLLAREETILPEDCRAMCHHVAFDVSDGTPLDSVINAAIEALPERWLYYCYNGEFLHFPFCESRSVEELTTFLTEERRDSAFTYVIDLYADNLDVSPIGYSLEDAHLDASGYYALTRSRGDTVMERQLSIFGGLKWRFEEHLPLEKRRIDRVALFRAEKGLRMDEYQLFSNEEYNTYQCPWHNSVTVAICSFRTAKYLKSNPGSTFDVASFSWAMSEKFHWNSQQLMDLGLMEPGQWF